VQSNDTVSLFQFTLLDNGIVCAMDNLALIPYYSTDGIAFTAGAFPESDIYLTGLNGVVWNNNVWLGMGQHLESAEPGPTDFWVGIIK